MLKPFEKKIILGFVPAPSILAIIGIASYKGPKDHLASHSSVSHTRIIIGTLEKLFSNLKDTEASKRGYLLADEESCLEPYFIGKEKTLQLSEEMKVFVKDNGVGFDMKYYDKLFWNFLKACTMIRILKLQVQALQL